MNIELDPQKADHKCESIRDGDWIIFTCPKCPGYERRLNWRTKEMKIKNGNSFSHSGDYFPFEFKDAFTNVN